MAVLSYAYWQRRFGGSADSLGSTLTINGADFTIVGVGPRDFVGVWLETPVDVWVPLTAQPLVKYAQSFSADGADLSRPWLPQSKISWLHVVARVPPDQVSVIQISGLRSDRAATHDGQADTTPQTPRRRES